MTAVSPSTPAPTSATAANRTTTSQSLGQADFLRLLTTQMTQQDPLNPLDNNAFVAQMAQFSQVSGIAEINQSLSAITTLLRGSASGSLAGWIGHAALVDSNAALPLDDGDIHGVLAFDQPASGVTLSLTDQAGKNLVTRSLGDVASGDQDFAITPPVGAVGPFHLSVTSANGQTGTISSWTRIDGVRSPSTGANATLITPVEDVPPASIRRIG